MIQLKPILRKLPILLLVISIFGLALNSNFYTKKNKEIVHFALPADLMEHLVLGFRMVAADAFWIRLIQDFDFKDKTVLIQRKGWVFHMADVITNLDHRYKIVYISAGTLLSVGIKDSEGAALLFEKGEKYVTDWSMFYRAGYHFLFEVHDCAKAAHFFLKAVDNGAPVWLRALASRAYSTGEQFELAVKVIDDSLEEYKDTPYEPMFQARKEELIKQQQGLAPGVKNNIAGLCH